MFTIRPRRQFIIISPATAGNFHNPRLANTPLLCCLIFETEWIEFCDETDRNVHSAKTLSKHNRSFLERPPHLDLFIATEDAQK